MLNFRVLVVLLFFNFMLYCAEPAKKNITTDKEALISFMSGLKLKSPNPLLDWDYSSSPCNWNGVICNIIDQRVVGLNLSSWGLKGTISPHIGKLSFLNSLELQNNQFIGTIPHEISKLFRLRLVNISYNSIQGTLPSSINELTQLQVLDLMENDITGILPAELGDLTKLQVLNLGKNLFYGVIPPTIGNLSSLTSLNLGTNTLSGNIPSDLGRLHNLKELDITINNLTGTIPSSIYNMSSLVDLAVASNQLWGEIPYDIGKKLPNLLVFNFCFNKFTGRIPGSLHNLTRIRVIRMAHNLLEGEVPPGLGNLPFLQMYNIGFNKIVSSGDDGLSFITSLTNSTQLNFLAIDGNHLEGLIPESIGNLSKVLSKLYMRGNRIYGTIPPSIGHLKGLTLLNLNHNSIFGEIPPQLGQLQGLQMLGLASNNISGVIPNSLGDLQKLNNIDLSGNLLFGLIPSSFGNFQNLLSMDLSKNLLNGTIPKELLNLPSLSTYLNLSNNFLSGSLPVEIGLLKNVITIELSNNHLSGSIPTSISNCKSLERLFLAKNRLSGLIPNSLGEVKGLEMLDLSSNQFSGNIPNGLQNLQVLQYLNLSFNDLEGGVPNFKNMSSVYLEGNRKLCSHLSCLKPGGHRRRVLVKICIVTAVFATLAVCFAVFLLFFRLKKAKVREAQQVFKEQHQMVSYEDLRVATQNFSDKNLIGKGSFGSVYKGYQGQGITIAVKVLNTQMTGAFKSFVAECEALKTVRHRNLMKLVTCCSSIDCKKMEFLALVYEYLSNGNLEHWITGRKRKEGGKAMNIVERLNVAIDVASALDYLHNDCEAPVIHCDIKPSNILLDADMTAKVGDFGLARLLMNNLSTQASISSTHVLKGSIGYIPPEYGLGEKPTTAGDTYSFGVTLLELFTGKSPTHESFTGELNLCKWVQSAYPKNIVQVIDQDLLQLNEDLYHKGQCLSSELQYDCVNKIIEIGLSCVVDSSERRNNMRRALHQLKTARKTLFVETLKKKNIHIKQVM